MNRERNETEYEVGYGRPPLHSRFGKNHQPSRRRKGQRREARVPDVLWTLLQEQRRVTIGGKSEWKANAELLVERAFELAEKGNSSISRLLAELLLPDPRPATEASFEVASDPDAPNFTGHFDVVSRFGRIVEFRVTPGLHDAEGVAERAALETVKAYLKRTGCDD